MGVAARVCAAATVVHVAIIPISMQIKTGEVIAFFIDISYETRLDKDERLLSEVAAEVNRKAKQDGETG